MSRQKSIFRLLAEPLLIAVVLALGVRAAVNIYSIPSASMRPSLEAGDHIVAIPYRGSSPKRGDVIVFRSPLDQSELMVKRVIAVAGDLIDSRSGRVRIGEHALAEPYILHQATSGAINAQLVPQNSFFVMGDNREDSLDSRRWGALPGHLVVGRVRMILWSSGDASIDDAANASSVSPRQPVRNGVRLSRIFKCVE